MWNGHLYKNKFVRSGKRDPGMLGWIDMENGKVSVAAWVDSLTGEVSLSFKPKDILASKYTYGNLKVNNARKNPTHPHLLGTMIWSGKTYSIAGWIHTDKRNDKFFKLTVREVEEVYA